MSRARRRQISRWRKRFIRSVGLSLLVIGFVAGVLLFAPFSSSILDTQARRLWRTTLGSELAFRRAAYSLARGILEVRGIQISRPDDGGEIAAVDAMRLRWQWRPLRPSAPVQFESVEIVEPAPVRLYLDERLRFIPDDRLRSLLDLVEQMGEALESRGGTPEVGGVFRLEVSDLRLEIWEGVVESAQEGTTPTLADPARTPAEGPSTPTLNSPVAESPTTPSLSIEVSPTVETSATLPASGPVHYPPVRPVTRLAEAAILKVDVRYDLRGRRRVQLSGRIAGGARPAGIDLRGESRGNGGWGFDINLTGMNMARQFRRPLPLTAAADQIQATVILLPFPGDGSAAADLKIQTRNLRLARPRNEATPPAVSMPIDLVASARLSRTPDGVTTPTLSAEDLRLQALGSNLAGDLLIGLDEKRRFSLNVNQGLLLPEALSWVQSLEPRLRETFTWREGLIEPTLRLAGTGEGLDWLATRGRLRGVALVVESPALNEPVGPMDFDLQATSQSLTLAHLKLQALPGSAQASMEASRVTDADGGLALDLGGRWSANLDLGRIETFLGDSLPSRLADGALRGRLTGAGGVQGRVAPETLGPALDGVFSAAGERLAERTAPLLDVLAQAMHTTGSLTLREGRLDAPPLPGSLESVSGEVVWEDDRASIREGRAELLGSQVQLGGEVTGRERVWREPRVELTLAAGIDLARLGELLKRAPRALLDRLATLNPTGRLDLDLALRGPAFRPRAWRMRGDVALREVSMQVQTAAGERTLHDGELRASLTDDGAVIKRLAGHLASIDFASTGVLSLAAPGAVVLETSGDLADYHAILPEGLRKFWVLDGPVDLSLKATFMPRTLPPLAILSGPAGRLLGLGAAGIANLPPHHRGPDLPLAELGRGDIDGWFEWNLDGLLALRDCEVTHRFMPAPVKHAQGSFRLQKNGFHTVGDLPAQWGQSTGLTSGTVRLVPGETPYVKFVSRFFEPGVFVADDWFQAWGRPPDMPPPSRPTFPGMDRPFTDWTRSEIDAMDREVVIEGAILADRVAYRRFQFQNVASHFVTDIRSGRPSLLEFDNVRGEMYGGSIWLQTWMYFFGPDVGWELEVDLNDVASDELLTAHYGKPSTVKGRLTAQAWFGGVNDDMNRLHSRGVFHLDESRFLRNPLFSGLGAMLRSDQLEDISFTNLEGRYSLRDGVIDLPALHFRGTGLELEASGTAWLDGRLDLVAVYRFLNRLRDVPLVGAISSGLNYLGSRFFKIHVGGTFEEPQFDPLFLSADELPLLRFQGLHGNGSETPPQPTPQTDAPAPDNTAPPMRPAPDLNADPSAG